MDKLRKVIAILVMALTTVYAMAQDTVVANAPPDIMRSNGKIYVVMTVVTIIVIGLLLYVMSVDRKIGKLEKK